MFHSLSISIIVIAFYVSTYDIYSMNVITVPNAAEALSMTNRTTRSLTVKWDAPTKGGLTGYSVTVEGGGKTVTQSLANDTTTHTFVDLKSGTQYTVSVVTLAGEQKSESLIGKYYTGMCRKEHLHITSIVLLNIYHGTWCLIFFISVSPEGYGMTIGFRT